MNKSEKFISDLVNLFHNDYIDPPEFNKVIHKYKKKEKEKEKQEKNTSTLWHYQHENILKHISELSEWYKEIHLYTAEKYNKLGNYIYAPLIVSTLSVGLFTLIANNYEEIIDSKVLVVITGGCNLCSGTITGILKKWNLSKWISSHQMYADKFLNISQQIKYQLSLPCDNREKMPSFLHKIVAEYHEATLCSPKIPSKYLKSFKKNKKLNINTCIDEEMTLPSEIIGIKSTDIYDCSIDYINKKDCSCSDDDDDGDKPDDDGDSIKPDDDGDSIKPDDDGDKPDDDGDKPDDDGDKSDDDTEDILTEVIVSENSKDDDTDPDI